MKSVRNLREVSIDEAFGLVRAGERVHFSVAWNHSFHEADFWLAARVGPGVRKPHSEADLRAILEGAFAEEFRRWRLSRAAEVRA
jgi:hypothetical protein